MNIILVSNKRGQTWHLKISPANWRFWLPAGVAVFALLSGVFWVGFKLAPVAPVITYSAGVTSLWQREIDQQRAEIAATRDSFNDNINALAYRLGELQAHVTRLNAVGQRLTVMAHLDPDEFNFSADPPVGGPEEATTGEVVVIDESAQSSLDQFTSALDEFTVRLDERERQMRVLQDLLVATRLREQAHPSGYPVLSGWIASGFGWRHDPFTGRSAIHRGIDFAARPGADVIAVGAGIVSFAGDRNGYGQLVEINHGNGYVTRYAHNSRIVVRLGESVLKGQRIALVGSTGRSTGPHVHFEVVHNGVVVNPASYIKAGN